MKGLHFKNNNLKLKLINIKPNVKYQKVNGNKFNRIKMILNIQIFKEKLKNNLIKLNV